MLQGPLIFKQHLHIKRETSLRHMHKEQAEVLLSTKYVCEERELEGYDLARIYDDFRGAGDFEMDSWVQDVEQLFTVREILSLFSDI